MERSLVDRLADTTAFRVLMALSACAVLPVLGIGVLMTIVGGAALVTDPQRIEAGQMAFGLLALGGALGMVGWVRALIGVRAPVRHVVAATLLLLAAGILAAVTVAGFVAAFVAEAAQLRPPSDAAAWLALGGVFVAADLVWVLAGIAAMRRLLRRYAESTGRPFDTLPVVLLGVAIVLATSAALATALL